MMLTLVKRLHGIGIAAGLGLALIAATGAAAAPATTPSSAACTPTGGSLAVNATVSCSFTAGTDGSQFLFWSAPGFTPQSSGDAGPTFTAARAGTASITAYWAVPGLGSQAQTFSYTVAAAATSASANCTPGDGSTIARGSSVTCAFTGSGVRFMFWSAPGFSPLSSGDTNPTFTALRDGSGSITAHWSQPGLGAQSQTFTYTITG